MGFGCLDPPVGSIFPFTWRESYTVLTSLKSHARFKSGTAGAFTRVVENMP